MHLWFNHVHGAAAGVAPGRVIEIMQGYQRCDNSVHDALKYLIPIAIKNCRIGH